MDYGFWFLFTDGWGHTDQFTGPFDYFMDFFFYLPNLLVAQVFIRRHTRIRSAWLQWASVIVLSVACLFLVLATYFFTSHLWGPAIVALFGY